MGKLSALKAILRRKRIDRVTEADHVVDLAADEFEHNLRKAIENGKLQSETAVIAETQGIQEAVRKELAQNESDLMELVASSAKTIKEETMEEVDAEHERIRESLLVQTRELSEQLTQEVAVRARDLRSKFDADLEAVRERCDQRLKAVEIAVTDACNLEDAEKERRIAELRAFLAQKVDDIRVTIEDEVLSAKAEIRRLVQQQAEAKSDSDSSYRWVTVDEKSTGRRIQVLASTDGNEVHCGACGQSACKHAVKVAQVLRLKALSA